MKAKLTLEDGRTIDIELTPEQEKAMEVKKVGRWKPKHWEAYYCDNWYKAYRTTWVGTKFDNWHLETWEVYKTEQEAQFARDRKVFITKVNDRIDELNDGWVADWSNSNQMKYYIYWIKGLDWHCSNTRRWDVLNCVKSREVAEQIISEFKDDLMKYIFN